MKRLCFKIFLLFLLPALTFSQNLSAEDRSGDKKHAMRYYEFEELTVKVKIEEPEVYFILDEPDVDVQPFYGDIDFLKKIEEPILKEKIF